MPASASSASPKATVVSQHAKTVAGLVATVLLCLPSVVGGIAFAFNRIFYSDYAEWEQTSAAMVALGVLIGGPLVMLAAVFGGVMAFSRNVPAKAKYAHLSIIGLAALSAVWLLLSFAGMSAR